MTDYLDLNRANWDERAPAHAASPDYRVERFVSDPEYLSGVVRFDLPRLGDVAGLDALHLQCHIGTDTLSLQRLGARVTGLDLSPASLEQARTLAQRAGAAIDYMQGDVYGAVEALGGRTFDLVYTGVGALCWLPSVRRWAEVVAALLRPGGRLHLREGHPMLWALDETDPSGKLVVGYPYFETAEPLVFDDASTYVETDHAFTATVTHEWNHGLAEIVTALMDAGLRPTMLVEHDSVPWEALPGQMELVEVLPARDGHEPVSEWRLRERPERLAATYTLQAVKPA